MDFSIALLLDTDSRRLEIELCFNQRIPDFMPNSIGFPAFRLTIVKILGVFRRYSFSFYSKPPTYLCKP